MPQKRSQRSALSHVNGITLRDDEERYCPMLAFVVASGIHRVKDGRSGRNVNGRRNKSAARYAIGVTGTGGDPLSARRYVENKSIPPLMSAVAMDGGS